MTEEKPKFTPVILPTFAELSVAIIASGVQNENVDVRNLMWFHVHRELKTKNLLDCQWLNFKRRVPGQKKDIWGPPDPEQETTYENCYQFTWDMDKRILRVKLYNGDMVYGDPTSERCEFSWIVGDEHEYTASRVKKAVMDRLAGRAQRIFENREEARVKAEVTAIYNSFFTPSNQYVQSTKEQQA